MSNVIIPMEQTGLVKNYQERLAPVVEALDASSVSECVECGALLGGLLGAFTWGIIHGQGECSRCGFPYVYYHHYEVPPFHESGDPMEQAGKPREILFMAFVPNADIPLAEKS
jgi:hypothetical protein